MERSMQSLNTRRIDLIQVHNLIDTQTHLHTLREWKQRQRVRYIGVTHYRVDAYDELMRIISTEDIDFAQFNYNMSLARQKSGCSRCAPSAAWQC